MAAPFKLVRERSNKVELEEFDFYSPDKNKIQRVNPIINVEVRDRVEYDVQHSRNFVE